MKITILTLILGPIVACAQPGLAPPQLGFIADSQRSLRPVLGFAGNTFLGASRGEDIRSIAWCGSYGLDKTSDALKVLSDQGTVLAALDVGPGPALFAFRSPGVPGWAFLPQSGALYSWTGRTWKAVSFRADLLDGEVLAIAADGWDVLRLVVERADGLWLVEMSIRNGQAQAQSALPGVRPPVLLQSDGSLLYADQTALVTRDGRGNESRQELGFPIGEIRLMAEGWVHVIEQNAGRQFAIRITPGRQQISQLPEMQ